MARPGHSNSLPSLVRSTVDEKEATQAQASTSISPNIANWDASVHDYVDDIVIALFNPSLALGSMACRLLPSYRVGRGTKMGQDVALQAPEGASSPA